MKNFNYSENGLYFLTICVKNKNLRLCNIVGRDVPDAPYIQLTKTGEIVQKHIFSINNAERISVHKFVIMPDHIHLLLFIDNVDGASGTSRPTHSLVSRTVSGFKRLCNKEIGENIWQTSFFDHVIRNETDYKTHYKYIENNPVMWLLNKHSI
ncbi:MAG: transposase [Clostridia bacterium]|nr:transposase [Clostridia bacterium]